MHERRGHEHQTPMFLNGFSVAHAILIQAQMRFTVLRKGLHLPDIMPPKVEAFTRCTFHPKNGYATGSLWRCPSGWSCSSPPPASRAGSCYIHDASPHVGIFPWLSMHVNTGRTVPS